MIPNKKVNTVKVVGEKSKEFTLTKGSSFITELIVDIYRNPARAVIRELVSNAVDEHIKYNVEQPIELTIPTNYNQSFSIRDFGAGLSERQIEELFTVIGDSSKRDTNSQIGGFGIGRLSVFTCTDSAVLTSFYNNKKTIYFWSRTNDGGIELSKQFEGESKEKNGLLIEFYPDKTKDLKFEDELDVVSFFKIPIKCNVKINNSLGELIFFGNKYQIYRVKSYYNRKKIVTMGGVPYSISREYFSFLDNLDTLIIESPVGSLDIVNNRDELRYTKKTKDKLQELENYLKNNLKKEIQEKISNSKTPLEAIELSSKMSNYTGATNSIIWKEKEYFKIIDTENVFKRKIGIRDSKTTLSKKQLISKFHREPLKKRIIVIDDLGKKSESVMRHYCYENEIRSGYFYIFESVEHAKKVTLHDPDTFIIVSDYIKKLPKGPASPKRQKTKQELTIGSADVFSCNAKTATTYLRNKITPEDKKTTDVFNYIEIYRYESYYWARLQQALIYKDIDGPIYLLRKNKSDKYVNAVCIHDEIDKILKEQKEKESKYKKEYAVSNSNEFKILAALVKGGLKNRKALTFYEKYKKFDHKTLTYIGTEVPRDIENFLVQYPLTRKLNSFSYLDEDIIKELILYMNMKDKEIA